MEHVLKQLGKRIRELRIERGFASQEALADHLQMHRTFIGHLETGRKDFRLTTLIRVAGALDVRLSDLFAGVDGGETMESKPLNRKAGGDRQALRRELAALERAVSKMRKLLQ